MFDHFVGLALKGLNISLIFKILFPLVVWETKFGTDICFSKFKDSPMKREKSLFEFIGRTAASNKFVTGLSESQ